VPAERSDRGGEVDGDTWSPVASHSEVTFGRGRSEWPPPQAQAHAPGQPVEGSVPDTSLGRTNEELAASDMEWGEPVWSDAVPADPPPPAVDWRKSIPREFVARRAPGGRPVREPVRPEGPPPVAPMANGQTYPPAPSAEHEDDGPSPAGRHAVRGDEPSRANGINGTNGTIRATGTPTPTPAPTPMADPAAGDAPAAASEHDGDLAASSDDTGVWNALDREIARALATALAGKLAQYVTGPILPLVADELARMVGSSAPAEEGEDGAHTGEQPPRHFGDGTPRR
jgi:hypothetical protein